MIYTVSKIAGMLLLPSTLIVLILGGGLVMAAVSRRRRSGLVVAALGFVALLAAGYSPLANAVVLPLEERFAGVELPGPGEEVAGIIILGGFEDGWVSAGRPGLAVNEAAERLTEGVRLARRYPGAKVVFTGAAGGLVSGRLEAAGPVGAFLLDVGIAPERVVLEAEARNTWQNATLTRALVDPKPGERWLLVTSAFHMPRSVGVFRQNGFEVIPVPTDFRTRGSEDLTRMFDSIPDGLKRLDLGAREWIGLVSYYAMGRMGGVLPGP